MHSFFYEGKTEAGNMVCEHVNFNKNIKDSGARIFINTSLINTKYTDHSRRITLVFTFMRILRYLNVTKIKSKLSIKNK